MLWIEGTGSSASFSGNAVIGSYGPAEVYVGPGARLTTGSTSIGRSGDGSVVVAGPDAHWTTSFVNVGDGGLGDVSTGSVQVGAGGGVETTGGAGEVWVGQRPNAVGRIDVEGGGSLWRARGLAIAGSTTVAGAGAGSVRIADGGVFDVSGGPVDVWQGGTLDLDGGSLLAKSVEIHGILLGTGSISGDVTNAGAVSPGHSPGVLDIDGSYVQSTDSRSRSSAPRRISSTTLRLR